MKKAYTIADDFVIADTRVLALSEKRELSDFNTRNVIIDDIEYPYTLTHNEYWVVIPDIQNVKNFTGKTLTFN